MRVETIELSWFRGAAENCVLTTADKNVVIYGANGSGKSSFADAIEYIINGKIEHLSHEYSGSRQEKGIRNTHAPNGESSTIKVVFKGNAYVGVEITPDGIPSFQSSPIDLIDFIKKEWELEHFVLRQDEVAAFIVSRKGDKYSALLPLLGLQNLEQGATNLHNLKQYVSERGELTQKETKLAGLTREANEYLTDLSEKALLEILTNLAGIYVKGDIPSAIQELAHRLLELIQQRITLAAPEIKRYMTLEQIRNEDLASKLGTMNKAQDKITEQIDELLDHKIAVLESASDFTDSLDSGEGTVECPACGRIISTSELTRHINEQLQALGEIRSARNEAKETLATLKDSIKQVLSKIKDEAISTWLEEESQSELSEKLSQIAEIDVSKWQVLCPHEDRAKLNTTIPIIVSSVKNALDTAPPPISKLLEDKKTVEVIASVSEINALDNEVKAIKNIIEALDAAEFAIRESIKSRTEDIIRTISVDIQFIWSKLHPGEPIEDVKLYLPEDADKAIDIGLKFYGVEQPSPRITLSEGHRNSLGLCIFLALARADQSKDCPIFLDDIISSLDREHRGMVNNVLLEDLTNRQVLLFTHDREWFQELRAVLPHSDWKFMVLRPWDCPAVGLQWSDSKDTFDDARALIGMNDEAAGNRVRAIMDMQLAIITERLRIMMHYARGDRNDHRTCIDFFPRIISEAKERLRKRVGESWEKYTAPISDWEKANRLLVSWANRSSHTGSLVSNEVEQLIEACEIALAHFKCDACGDYVWIADLASRERLQCSCGQLQWRYS